MIESLLLTAALIAPSDDAREAAVTRPSRHSSMIGVRASTYRGDHFTRAGERFRLCVIARESRGNYAAANPSSSARGAYQFLDRSWRVSLAHMIRAELRSEGVSKREARSVFTVLSSNSISRWSRSMQDMAFFLVLNHGRPFSGAKHWYLAGSSCNALGGLA